MVLLLSVLLTCASLLATHKYPMLLSTRIYKVDSNKIILNASPQLNRFVFPFRLFIVCAFSSGLIYLQGLL